MGPWTPAQDLEAAGPGQDAWVPHPGAVLDEEAGLGETNWQGLDFKRLPEGSPLGWRWAAWVQVGSS